MIDEKVKLARELFMPIAVFEHHQLANDELDVYDICKRLGALWERLKGESLSKKITFSADCVTSINKSIADALETEPGSFKDRDTWQEFVEASGGDGGEQDAYLSWVFSELYWNRLSRLKLATCWFFTNLINLQRQDPIYKLSLDKLGPF